MIARRRPGRQGRPVGTSGRTRRGRDERLPGRRFRRAGAVDAHHDRFRVGGELVGRDGTVTTFGTALDGTAAELSIEAFPADAATASALQR